MRSPPREATPESQLFIRTPLFFSRTRRQLDKWQIILLVDESGSMLSSVIHAAVTAACLWGLPSTKTHLCIFDTEVVDLTDRVTDPVEVLMKVQLGGGTDIGRAVTYAAGLVENPRALDEAWRRANPPSLAPWFRARMAAVLSEPKLMAEMFITAAS